MDELLRQNLSELVALLTSMLQGGLDKMPTLFEQILAYGVFDAKIGLLFGIILVTLALVLCALTIWSEYVHDNDLGVFLVVGVIVLLCIGVPFILGNTVTLWSVSNTPELYVLKKVMQII